jgi:hypothetical protein
MKLEAMRKEVANIVDDFKIGETSCDNVELKVHGTDRLAVNLPGWRKNAECECNVVYALTQSALLRSYVGVKDKAIVIELEDGSTISFTGYLSSFGFESPLENVMKNTIKIMPQTDPVLAEGSGSSA